MASPPPPPPPLSPSPSTSTSPTSSSSFADSLVDFLDQPFLINVSIVLFLLWLASAFRISSDWMFIVAFLFLLEANRIYVRKVRQQMRSKERRSALQERPLSDFQAAPWLNQAIEKIWQSFLEKFISQVLLKPMVPWFLEKFKPATVGKVMLLELSLGREPPKFTGVRIVDSTSKDDDLVMELNLEFSAANDMIAVLSAQMRGLGFWTNIHISKLDIGGKVRVGIKVINQSPYLSRVRLCFMTAPVVQMTVRPIFTHGVNVSDIPLVSGWMERLVADVFEQCLVQPNMLTVNIEGLVNQMTIVRTADREVPFFEIQEMGAIATAHLKIVEALELKPSDLNGLADPFVKVSCGNKKFRTKIEKTTLSPKWNENFDIPIFSWETLPPLLLHLYDKDTILDDKLGFCSINLADYRGGDSHDLWIPLQSVKTGKLHILVKVEEEDSTEKLPVEEVADDSVEKIDPIPEKSEIIKIGIGDGGFVSIVSPGERYIMNGAPQSQTPSEKDAKNKSKNHVESSEAVVDQGIKEMEVFAENESCRPELEAQDNASATSSVTSESEASVPDTPSKRVRAKGKAKEMMKSASRHFNSVFNKKQNGES